MSCHVSNPGCLSNQSVKSEQLNYSTSMEGRSPHAKLARDAAADCSQPSDAASRDKDALPLNDMVDDCLAEIYRHCQDSRTKCSLRHVCRATYSSPAINCQLGKLDFHLENESDADTFVLACCYPKHATVKHLDVSFNGHPGSALWLACADDSLASRLSTVRELKVATVFGADDEVRTWRNKASCEVICVLNTDVSLMQ